MQNKKLRPKDVFDIPVVDTRFQNEFIDNVIKNIINVSHTLNPNAFEPFTWLDYYEFSPHSVSRMDFHILEAMVFGGKPSGLLTQISSGYLEKKGDKYIVTDRFLEVVSKVRYIETSGTAA